jgi:hypothetical protein
MQHQTHAKVQHYVPQFILRNHSAGKKHQVWAFDKHRGRSFRSNVRNLAAASGFYDLDTVSPPISLEPMLAELESQAKPVFDRIVTRHSLHGLDRQERQVISEYLATQYLRTDAMREMQTSMETSLRLRLAKEPMTDELRAWMGEPSVESTKEIMLGVLRDASQFTPHFLNKLWFLFSCPPRFPFYIGDHPVVLHNRRRDEHRGTLGLAVPGIEIYFPLTPTLTLALLSPEIGQVLMTAGVDDSKPVLCDQSNVTFQNSLQVAQATRFVFCVADDFDLVRQMVRDDPGFLRGRTIDCR